jgi:hypothetical protein
MTDPGEVPSLEELEPIDETSPSPIAAGAPVARVGLPAPFYNRGASKAYYRMMFGGVLMTVGCLMPFGPELGLLGYRTLGGGISFVIALGLLWASWVAIHFGRPPSLKWFLLPLLPLVLMIFHVVGAFSAPSVEDVVRAGAEPIVTSWGDLFSTLVDRDDAQRYLKIGNFFRAFGPGKLFVFFGALIAFLTFVQGLFGGVAVNRQKASTARVASAERRKR